MAYDHVSYEYVTYADNWSYYKPNGTKGYAAIAPNVNGATAFAVVNNDGNLDVRYPVSEEGVWVQGINPGATYALTIGGWNNSNLDPTGVQNMGLYNVLTNNQGSYINPTTGLTGPQRMLINTLYVATLPKGSTWTESDLPYNPGGDPQLTPQITLGLGFKCIIMDFEGFGPGSYQNPAMVTTVMQQLSKMLPGALIQMAIPGSLENQSYLNILALMTLSNMKFHLMLYDYAAGLNPLYVTSNASISTTYTDLQSYNAYSPSFLNQCYVGFPNYGRGFVVASGLTVADLSAKIGTGKYLAISYAGPSNGNFDSTGLISDDNILELIGSWDTPSNGWQLVSVSNTTLSYNDYYYYNPSNGLLISAFPNGTTVSSVDDLASMILDHYPSVSGFMNWEAEQEANQITKKMTSLITKINSLTH